MKTETTYITILVITWFLSTIILFTEAIGLWPGKQINKLIISLIYKIKKKINLAFEGQYGLIYWFMIAFFVVILIIIALPITANKSYSYKEIIENIYPEIYGLLFDVILFGIIISIYNIFRNKKDEIQNQEDQIDDFRGWKSIEASHRILGSVKRLQRLGKSEIDLSNCYFKDITLRDLCFEKSRMTGLTILNAELYNNTFHDIYSNHFTCRDSQIKGCSFQYGEISFILHTTDVSSLLLFDLNLKGSFCPPKISFTLFESVDFSYCYFKFKEIEYTEFKNCTFNECVVPKDFFSLISDKTKNIIGHEKIKNEYDLVQEVSPNVGSKNPVWILRNKKEGKTSRPAHRVKPSSVIIMTDPWARVGRCNPF